MNTILVVLLPDLLRFAGGFRLILYGLILVLTTILMPIGIIGIGKAPLGRLVRTGLRHGQ